MSLPQGAFWGLSQKQAVCYTGCMQIVLAIFSLGLLGMIIFFAFSPKSSRLLRRAAFIALALIALSLVIGGLFLVFAPGETPGVVPLPFLPEAPPAAPESGIALEVIVFLLLFLIVMGIIIGLAHRDQHKKDKKMKDGKKGLTSLRRMRDEDEE